MAMRHGPSEYIHATKEVENIKLYYKKEHDFHSSRDHEHNGVFSGNADHEHTGFGHSGEQHLKPIGTIQKARTMGFLIADAESQKSY